MALLFLLLSVSKDTLLWFDIMDNNQTRRNNFLFVYHLHRQTCRFTVWANGKRRTGKLRLGIAFTICTNQFHLPKNGLEGPKLEQSVRKHRTTFQMFRCSRKFSNDTKSSVYFPAGFSRNFSSMVNNFWITTGIFFFISAYSHWLLQGHVTSRLQNSGRFPFNQTFRNLKTGTTGTEISRKKFPEIHEAVEFPKCEPFNWKFYKFPREQS